MFPIRSIGNYREFLTLLTGSRLCASRRPVRLRLRGAYKFIDESACLRADVWNEGKLLTLWVASRHYISRRGAVHAWEFIYDFQLLAAVISPISQLFSVTISEESWCGML
jgi:hypothetical protein